MSIARLCVLGREQDTEGRDREEISKTPGRMSRKAGARAGDSIPDKQRGRS